MEDINFEKGMYPNSTPLNTPPGYYRDAFNMFRNKLSVGNEPGHIKIDFGVSGFGDEVGSMPIFGTCVIGSDSIIIGVKNNTVYIGVLNKDDVWELKLSMPNSVFKLTEIIQVEGRKNWKNESVIYFSSGNKARRVNLDSVLPSSEEELDKITSLFLDYDLPVTTFTSQSSTGSVYSGVYQFAVRLVTESLAETPFGIMTGVIPVTKSSVGAYREDVVGGEPQSITTKAINLNISNVDTAFKYIQIGVLTYIGLANTPVVNVTNIIAINGRTSIDYTYYGDRDHSESITLPEFIASGVSYKSGGFFTQKDDTLLIGAPVEKELPNINWHRVAENIVSEYTVKEVDYKENLQFEEEQKGTGNAVMIAVKETSNNNVGDLYKNPKTCEEFKTYRRGEIYGFTLTPQFTSGVLGPTVHIPAIAGGVDPTVYPNKNDGGLLGSFLSQQEYPDDRYPGIAPTSKIRLHRFPTAKQQPLISGSVENNTLKVRLLGVKFSNIKLDPTEAEFENLIAGYIIGRLDRSNNETQLAQGIARPIQNIRHINDDNGVRSSSLGDGHVNYHLDANNDTLSPTIPTSNDLSEISFISPDIIHNLHSSDEATHIYQHSSYRCNPYAAKPFLTTGFLPGRDMLSRPNVAFKNIVSDGSDLALDDTKVELDANKRSVGPFGSPRQPGSKGGKENTTLLKGNKIIRMASSDGFEWLSTKTGEPVKRNQGTDPQYNIKLISSPDFLDSYGAWDTINNSSVLQATLDAIYATRPQFVLYSLYRNLPSPYGALDQMVSMQVHYHKKDDSGIIEFYNGDTFINKYGLSINDESFYPFPKGEESSGDEYFGFLKPVNFSMIVYMWIESSNNYDYKHYVEPSGFSADGVLDAGSVPYFPAYKTLSNNELPLGILSMSGDGWYRPGYASQYNNQYSAKPNIKPYAITPKEDQNNENWKLQNRVIYSAQSVQGEKADAFQIFLPNNYYDVPLNHGILTDLYVNKELYAATAQTQWLLFFNTLATQMTSAGETVLGNGGAFNRPAVPLQTVDGGLGGLTHWLHSVQTPNGRAFVDQLQGLVFLFGEKLEYVSDSLEDSLRTTTRKLSTSSIRIGSEPLHNRILVRLGQDVYSIDTRDKAVISRHSSIPKFMFSVGQFLYSQSVDSDYLYKHSVGEPNLYYDTIKESYIDLIVNISPKTKKNFKGLEVQTSSTDKDLNYLPFKFFDYLEVWNTLQYTGKHNLKIKKSFLEDEGVFETLVSNINNSFRLELPRNIVSIPSNVNTQALDVFDVNNHLQKVGDLSKTQWLEKIKGNFAVIRLGISGEGKNYVLLERISINLTPNIR